MAKAPAKKKPAKTPAKNASAPKKPAQKKPGQKKPEKTTAQQLDELFAPWNRTDQPGFVVGVARKGEVLYRRGFGMASLESAAANTPATRMRIGSTTKHFTCLLALLLAEEGKLDLDAPIRTYVAELTGPGGDPTLRQLMQHRGGSRCYLDIGFIGHGLSPAPKGSALAAQIRQGGRNFPPGEAMIYNNGGYHLASIAIERVGGAPFEDQLRARLFAPLAMNDTASIPTDFEITPGIATMHVPLSGGRWRRGLFPSDEVRGEGAMVSTIDDMLTWMAHLRARDRFGAKASWKQLTALPRYADGRTGIYALGLMVEEYRGLGTIHHAGGVFGGTCQMLTLPDFALDIIIVANGAPNANVVRLAEQVVDIVLADKVGKEAAAIRAKDYKALLGDWCSPETGMVYSLVDHEGELKLSAFRMPQPAPLRRTPDGRAVMPASSIGEIEFGLAAAAASGELPVTFGGRTASYRRAWAKARPKAAAAFADAVQGRYFSADADAHATITLTGDDLTIRLADAVGAVQAGFAPVSPSMAIVQPSAMIPLAAALTFDLANGAASAFRLNTGRTRGLEFLRE